MKSLFLLCEYSITVGTIYKLKNNNIKIEDIAEDDRCLDDLFGSGSVTKEKIIKAVSKIVKNNDIYSPFDLYEYGLSINICNNIWMKNIKIIDIINDKNIIGNKFGGNTSNKIYQAITRFMNSKDVGQELKEVEGKNNRSEKSIYNIRALRDVGLSYTLYNSLAKMKITVNDIVESDGKCIVDKFSDRMKYQIFEAIDNLQDSTNDSKLFMARRLKHIILGEYNYNTFTIYELESYLDELHLKCDLNYLINKLIENRELVKEENKYHIYIKTIDEVIEGFDGREKEFVDKKLSGMTLQEIGNEYGISRERVRQIIAKIIKEVPYNRCDYYKDIFTKYNIDQECFCLIFNENIRTYNYLKEKYSIGKKDVVELIGSDEIKKEQSEKLESHLNIFIYNGERIDRNRNSILLAILKFLKRKVSFKELKEAYNNLIDYYDFTDKLEYIADDDRINIDRFFMVSQYALNSLGDNYKYFDCDHIDAGIKKELKNMLNLPDGYYSTLMFFEKNPALMKELNIEDEYELHNLIRKLFEKEKNIKFVTMPNLFVGKNTDREEFIKGIINELSPITITELIDYMYENYGWKKASFRSYFTSNYSKYIIGDKIITDVLSFDQKEIEIMKKCLTKDIYSMKAVKKILNDELNKTDMRYINNTNLLNLGYKVRGNYILKASISTLEAYLREKICRLDYYEIDLDLKNIGSTYSCYLYDFISDNLMFKIDDNTYITQKKLEEKGISIGDINYFKKYIQNAIKEEQYFNVYYLYNKIDKELFNKFNEFGSNKFFIESLLTPLPELKYFRLKNEYFFIKSGETPNREKFINSIFKNEDKKYISDAKKEIKEKYNIEIDISTIKAFINRKQFYVHDSNNCVYKNREIFENENKSWDVLQYLK